MKGMNILPVGCEPKVLKIYFNNLLRNPPLHPSGSGARASSSLHLTHNLLTS